MGAKCPMQHLEKYHYVQCQVQMHCSGRGNTILMSYHPETLTQNYFLLKHNSEFITVLLTCLTSMFEKLPLQDCHRWDSSCQQLKSLWEKNVSGIPNFKSLQPLRFWIGQLIKNNTVLSNLKLLFNC